MTIDLHVHSTFSDGSMSPAELVIFAKKKGLTGLSITDHDTIDGTPEAQEVGNEIGLEIIPGVEISVNYKQHTVHLLGYYYLPSDGGLNKGLGKLQQGRLVRNEKILLKLEQLGITIVQSELEKISKIGQTGRPHIARLLVMKRVVKNMNEAFSKYLGTGAAAYVPRVIYEAEDAIELLKSAGGIAVLAHPLQLLKSGASLSGAVKDLARNGLDGIEAYYPTHSKKQKRMFLEMAENLDLVVTGGSDYHGRVRPGTTLAGGKNVSVPNVLLHMKERAALNRKKNNISVADLGMAL